MTAEEGIRESWIEGDLTVLTIQFRNLHVFNKECTVYSDQALIEENGVNCMI